MAPLKKIVKFRIPPRFYFRPRPSVTLCPTPSLVNACPPFKPPLHCQPKYLQIPLYLRLVPFWHGEPIAPRPTPLPPRTHFKSSPKTSFFRYHCNEPMLPHTCLPADFLPEIVQSHFYKTFSQIFSVHIHPQPPPPKPMTAATASTCTTNLYLIPIRSPRDISASTARQKDNLRTINDASRRESLCQVEARNLT